VSFANPIPLWGLLLAVLAAVAVAWHAYAAFRGSWQRRTVLRMLRFTTLLLLVLFLMRPVAIREEASGAGAVVPILVDTSRSMSIADADARPRIERAREWVSGELLPVLGDELMAEVLAFGESVSASPIDGHDRRGGVGRGGAA